MPSGANTFSLPASLEQGKGLSEDQRTELGEALLHLRAIMRMAEHAGRAGPLELASDDIQCLLKPIEERMARVLDSTSNTRH